MDREAWWVAVHWVIQSQTQLKRLSTIYTIQLIKTIQCLNLVWNLAQVSRRRHSKYLVLIALSSLGWYSSLETQKPQYKTKIQSNSSCIVCECSVMHPTPVLLPRKSHGRRSLVGCSPWGPLESDTTERLHFHFSLSCTGEGNGNPLECSCLENPRDGGAWWAAVYGVAQSRTQLKRPDGRQESRPELTQQQINCFGHTKALGVTYCWAITLCSLK